MLIKIESKVIQERLSKKICFTKKVVNYTVKYKIYFKSEKEKITAFFSG